MKSILIFSALLFHFLDCLAQTGTIRGQVVDAKTLAPVPLVSVFANNSTLVTVTDSNGNFVLRNVGRPSVLDLIISFEGYQSISQKISLTETELDLHILKLIPSNAGGLQVADKKGEEWKKYIKKFKKIFLGEDENEALCKIINPSVLQFTEDDQKKLIVLASFPLQIDNRALGYKIYFYLSPLAASVTDQLTKGNLLFEELTPHTDAEQLLWESNRKKIYLRSRQHLFSSIVHQRIKGEGFELYTNVSGVDSATSSSELFKSRLGRTLKARDTTDLITTISQKGVYKIVANDRVEIHYTREKEKSKTYRDVSYPVSWINLTKGYVLVNSEGIELNPADVITTGDMNKNRVTEMLPSDYMPDPLSHIDEEERNLMMIQLYEKIYIHTDKPYYYPGESVWFKGYLNYASPQLRDSLSQTAYVELIDREKKKVILSRTIQIDSGLFHGDFVLSDTLKAATYYLRAYTNWNRNFGPDNFSLKPMPILRITDKVDPKNIAPFSTADNTIAIQTDKSKYKTREKIILTMRLTDNDGNPIASNLSLSVTDASQVMPIKPFNTINEGLQIRLPNTFSTLSYPLEYGFTFSGRFLNDFNKPEKAMLSVVRLKPNEFYMSQSDEDGKFSVGGLKFYDTATFSIQANREKKGVAYGKVELLKPQRPEIDFNELKYPIDLIKTETRQRVSSYDLSKDAIVLKTVEVKSTRIRKEYEMNYTSRPYGRPDYVLKAKDINKNYGNLLPALQGKIPGLIVRQTIGGGPPTWEVFSQRTLSIGNPKEVLVTIDDVIMAGTPSDILGALDPNMIESVEVKLGVNVLYGHLGGSGIVAVYLKKGITEEDIIKKDFPIVKVNGYSQPREFKSPNYEELSSKDLPGDYRSLLYWNPNVTTNRTGQATISFYASDLSGIYHIIAEGITQDGRAVRKETSIEVVDK